MAGRVVAWAGILALAVCFASPARANLRAGEAFPELSTAGLAPLAGEAPSLGGRVMLIDFWASWCAPCKASFPMMAKLHRDYAARGFAVLAVSIDEKAAAAAAFVKKLAPPFAAVHDKDRKLVSRVGAPAMPTTYLVGRDGRVRFVHAGFHGEKTERELRKQIEALLAEKE